MQHNVSMESTRSHALAAIRDIQSVCSNYETQLAQYDSARQQQLNTVVTTIRETLKTGSSTSVSDLERRLPQLVDILHKCQTDYSNVQNKYSKEIHQCLNEFLADTMCTIQRWCMSPSPSSSFQSSESAEALSAPSTVEQTFRATRVCLIFIRIPLCSIFNRRR